jgi:CRP/FNR family cyclic AMP-dependent transcriptional regulator
VRQRSNPGADRFWPGGTFLATLAEPARRKLLSLGVILTLPADHLLIRQGDAGGSVWLLLDALVKVTAGVENGSRTLLAIRVSGDVVGEMAVVDGSPRSADVTTCSRAVVCRIKGAIFAEFLRQDAGASVALSQLAIQRLRWSNQRRLDFAGYEVPVCLARVLLVLAARHGRWSPAGVDIGVPLTQSELGGLVGAKEGTAQKALRDLAERGLARPGRRTVTILDVAGLTAFADLTPDSSAEAGAAVWPTRTNRGFQHR